MNRRGWLVWLMVAALAGAFSACTEEPVTIAVTVLDDLGAPLAGMEIYVDTGATPRATTTAAGEATLTLVGTHDVVVVDPAGGYATYSFLEREWDLVIALPVTLPLLTPYPLGATGTLTFTLSGGFAAASAIVTAASRYTSVPQLVVLNSDGIYLGGTVALPAGDYYLSVVHSDEAATNANAFFGTSGPWTVTAGGTRDAGNIVLEDGGKEFTISATGGLTGGEMTLGYQVYRLPGQLAPLITDRTAVPETSVDELTEVAFTPPSNTQNMGDASFVVEVVSSMATAASGKNYAELRRAQAFPTQPTMQASALNPLLALVDYQVLVSAPGHLLEGVVVGQFPDFVYALGADAFPDFVEVQIFEVVTPGSEYKLVHVVRDYDYSDRFTLPAATGGLNATGSYRYNVVARKLGFVDGALRSIRESARKNICFSTDDTAPAC